MNFATELKGRFEQSDEIAWGPGNAYKQKFEESTTIHIYAYVSLRSLLHRRFIRQSP